MPELSNFESVLSIILSVVICTCWLTFRLGVLTRGLADQVKTSDNCRENVWKKLDEHSAEIGAVSKDVARMQGEQS